MKALTIGPAYNTAGTTFQSTIDWKRVIRIATAKVGHTVKNLLTAVVRNLASITMSGAALVIWVGLAIGSNALMLIGAIAAVPAFAMIEFKKKGGK